MRADGVVDAFLGTGLTIDSLDGPGSERADIIQPLGVSALGAFDRAIELGRMAKASAVSRGLAAAHCCAYNTWALEVCQSNNRRLYTRWATSLCATRPGPRANSNDWRRRGVRAVFIAAMPVNG
jgi:hypothetical protein